MNLSDMLGSIGFVGACVMVCLLGLSVYSVTVILGKYRRFRAASAESTAFLPAFGRCLADGKLDAAVETARKHERSHVARVVSAGVGEMIGRDGDRDPATRVELVARALERSTVLTMSDLKQGLGTLATIGSTAPFIGLFGTVVGIMLSFETIGQMGSANLAVVGPGIAEALVATAAGLAAAIPEFREISRFPAIRRDIAVIVDESVPVEALRGVVRESAGGLLTGLTVLSVYRGKQFEKGKKSIALGLHLQDTSRTLTDNEADAVVAQVVQQLGHKLHATIRDK